MATGDTRLSCEWAPGAVPRNAVRERKLLRAARRGDRGARERLVAEQLGMVRAVASRYRELGLSLDDLVQEGAIGLLEAVDRFDPARNADFQAYARFRVRRAMRNALTEQARLVRLPKHVVARRRLLARTEERLIASTGRLPSAADLAAATGLSESAVVAVRAASIAPASIESRAAGAGSGTEVSVVDDTQPGPDRELLAAEQARLLRSAVDGLESRRREVVTRRFGLDGPEASVSRLAADLHLSERRTRTIEHDALHELADALAPALAGD